MTGKNLMIIFSLIVIAALFYFADVNPLQVIELAVNFIGNLIETGDNAILAAF